MQRALNLHDSAGTIDAIQTQSSLTSTTHPLTPRTADPQGNSEALGSESVDWASSDLNGARTRNSLKSH